MRKRISQRAALAMQKELAAIKPAEAHHLFDHDVVAPEFFAIIDDAPMRTHEVQALCAFVRAMMSLDRAVLLRWDADDEKVIVSSHVDTITERLAS